MKRRAEPAPAKGSPSTSRRSAEAKKTPKEKAPTKAKENSSRPRRKVLSSVALKTASKTPRAEAQAKKTRQTTSAAAASKSSLEKITSAKKAATSKTAVVGGAKKDRGKPRDVLGAFLSSKERGKKKAKRPIGPDWVWEKEKHKRNRMATGFGSSEGVVGGVRAADQVVVFEAAGQSRTVDREFRAKTLPIRITPTSAETSPPSTLRRKRKGSSPTELSKMARGSVPLSPRKGRRKPASAAGAKRRKKAPAVEVIDLSQDASDDDDEIDEYDQLEDMHFDDLPLMDADQPFDHASSPAPTYGQGAGRQVDVNAYGDSDLSDLDSPTPHERDDIAPEASPSGTPMEYGAAESSDSPSTYQSASMGGPGAGVGDASRSLNAQDAFMQPSHSRSGSSRRGSAPPATSVACEEDLSDLEEDSYSPPVRQHASTAAAEKPRPPENQSAIDELSDLDLDDDDVPQARDGVGRPSPREDLEARIGLTRPSPSSAADLEVEDLDSFSNPSSSGYAKPSQSGKGQFFPLRATGGMRQQRELRGSTHGGSTDRRARPRQLVEEEEEEEEGEAEEEEERLGSDLSDLSDQEDSGPSRPEDRTIPRPAASFLRRAEEALPSPEHASRTDRSSAALPKTSSFRSRTAGFDRRTESNPRREGTTRHEMASDSDFSDLE